MHTLGFQEEDLALLHSLQIAPRATWTDLAPVLGSTPTALAARWQRLRAGGLAWVMAYPDARGDALVTSLVEIDVAPGHRATVARLLCRDARVISVEESARGRDLLLTVLTPDLPSLTRFVLDDMAAIEGIERQRTHLATAVHTDGTSWRLDALDKDQKAACEAIAATMGPQPGVTPPKDVEDLIDALARDGRASAAELARQTGRSPATVRRQLGRMIGSGMLRFRCEVAQLTSQWPISCTWVARIPPAEQERTVAALGTLPELRLCISTTGDTNLMFTVWVRSLQHLMRLEQLLGERLPWLGIVDNAVTLRTPKRVGWLLDERGLTTGEVVPSSALVAPLAQPPAIAQTR